MMLLKTSLTFPKEIFTIYIRIRNITARIVETPVAMAIQPMGVFENLFALMGFPTLIGNHPFEQDGREQEIASYFPNGG
jgi:hypothetical protein